MSLIRPSRHLLTRSPLRNTISARPTTLRTSRSTHRIQPFSAAQSHNGGHGPTYDDPKGWLFGVKPGEKYQNEGWENIWFYGFFGGLAACTIGYIYKPDTSIQTWALEEARRRLEKEGFLHDPSKREG